MVQKREFPLLFIAVFFAPTSPRLADERLKPPAGATERIPSGSKSRDVSIKLVLCFVSTNLHFLLGGMGKLLIALRLRNSNPN